MHYLAITGDIESASNIISLLMDLGATNSAQHRGEYPDWVYCLNNQGTSTDIIAFLLDDVKNNPEYCIFSYADFLAHHPLWIDDLVDVPGNFENCRIIDVAWSALVGDVMYKITIQGCSVPNGGIGWWYWSDLADRARPTIDRLKKIQQPQPKVESVMDFGNALALLKCGKKVSRKGWNGKGMYLWLKPAATIKAEWCKDPMLKEIVDANGGEAEALGTICMKTADNKILTGWLASQSDMLAEDWVIVQ